MAVTQLDGSFVVQHVPPGEYFIAALAAGYLSPFDAVSAPTSSAKDQKADEKLLREFVPTIRENSNAQSSMDIEIHRGAVLAGRVLYSDGAPASQLLVSLQNTEADHSAKESPKDSEDPQNYGAALRAFVLLQPSSTDDQGHFRIAGIAPGKYRLAIPQSFEPSGVGEQLATILGQKNAAKGVLTVYSGDTLHKKDAKIYNLNGGDIVDDITITLPLSGLHTVSGIASAKDGTPLNVGRIELTDTSDPSISFHSMVRSTGDFTLVGIPEGSYTLKISNGRLLAPNLAQQIFDESQLPYLDQMGSAVRAFADTTQALIVQSADIQNLTITLADTKVPEPPKPQPEGEPNP